MKVYALDRMDSVAVLERHFDFEPTNQDVANLQNSFGHLIYKDIKPQKILIKAFDSAPDYLDTLPLHSSQKCVGEGEEGGKKYIIYEYYFAPTLDFEATLRKWGRQLEIIT